MGWGTVERDGSDVDVTRRGNGNESHEAASGANAGGSALQVSLNPLGPGTYRVKWRVLSVDTHVTEGDFTFRVTDGP
ncbi:MAG TPA: copper resistance protein CopC [Vicinamibacteria bacterium]|nr:copper resistance protein CopC [Vicinamibacteria bacterium]